MAKKRTKKPAAKKPKPTPKKRGKGGDKEGGRGSTPKRLPAKAKAKAKPKAKRKSNYKRPQHVIDRWRRFAKGVARHGNATEAYMTAGFKPRNRDVAGKCAEQLLRKTEVKAMVEAETARLATKIDISEDRFVEELRRIGLFDITDMLSFKEAEPEKDGKQPENRWVVTIKNSEDLPPEVTAAISEVFLDHNGNLKIKSHSKLEAIKTIGKIKGFLREKVDHGIDPESTKTLAEFMTSIDGQGRGLPTKEEIKELEVLEAEFTEVEDE